VNAQFEEPAMTPDLDTVERGKHHKDQRQRCLIEAATQVFAQKGYDAATTREVSEHAACSEGLIHRYFGGKSGLLMAILESKAETFMDASAEVMPEELDLGAEIEQILMWPVEAFWDDREFMRVCVARSVVDPAVGRLVGERLNGARVAFAAQRLRWHQRQGRIRADVDVDAVALSLSGLSFSAGFFVRVIFEKERGDVHRVVREIAKVITRGIESERTPTAKP
jgi:AcrR family transcriptional regulator